MFEVLDERAIPLPRFSSASSIRRLRRLRRFKAEGRAPELSHWPESSILFTRLPAVKAHVEIDTLYLYM